MSIIKLYSLTITLGALLVVAPSVGHPGMNGLPHRPQIGLLIQPDGSQLTDPFNSIYLAGLVGRQGAGSVKRPARSTLATLFDDLFGQKGNVFRPKASANISGRKPKRESKGPKLEEMRVTQPTATPNEKAVSLIAPAATPTTASEAATPTAASPQSPPFTPVLMSGPGTSQINALPALPLE